MRYPALVLILISTSALASDPRCAISNIPDYFLPAALSQICDLVQDVATAEPDGPYRSGPERDERLILSGHIARHLPEGAWSVDDPVTGINLMILHFDQGILEGSWRYKNPREGRSATGQLRRGKLRGILEVQLERGNTHHPLEFRDGAFVSLRSDRALTGESIRGFTDSSGGVTFEGWLLDQESGKLSYSASHFDAMPDWFTTPGSR